MNNLRELLESIADGFSSLGIPEPVVHWGHPLMMTIVVFVMGSFVGVAGWRGRVLAEANTEAAVASRGKHRQIAPLMYFFLAAGYTGGILSLVMQDEPILSSPHFLTGSIVLVLLTINAIIAATGFIGNNAVSRTIHAYVGSISLGLLLIHAVLGLKLGLSI